MYKLEKKFRSIGRRKRRQDLSIAYHRNGTFLEQRLVLNQKTLITDEVVPLECGEIESINIDSPLDYEIAKLLSKIDMKNKYRIFVADKEKLKKQKILSKYFEIFHFKGEKSSLVKILKPNDILWVRFDHYLDKFLKNIKK